MKKIPGLPHLTIGSIYCIGRNYAKHAEELGNKVPGEPLVFLKPASSLIGEGENIVLPYQSSEVHHEVELVIAIGQKGKNISEDNALGFVAGYGVGIDVTARDIQQKAKEKGHPWTVAKGFDTFAPVSNFLQANDETDFNAMDISLRVNGETRQQGNTRHMIFSVPELIAYLSSIFTLHPGDLIFTGTPKGVSAIQTGDTINASLNKGKITLSTIVKQAKNV